MERNTVLAIVLSSLVLIVSFVIQGILYPPNAKPAETQTQPSASADSRYEYQGETGSQQTAPSTYTETQPSRQGGTSEAGQADGGVTSIINSGSPAFAGGSGSGQETFIPQQTVIIETDLLIIELTNSGGDIVSWKLKDHLDKNENVEMIFTGQSAGGTHAFSVTLGDSGTAPVSDNFRVDRLSDYSVQFSRDFISYNYGIEERFQLIKRYEFKPKEYMFELFISLDGRTSDGRSSKNRFDFSGNAYILSFGPQIGPKFVKLDNNHEYRQYFTFVNRKRKNAKINDVIETNPSWAAITGKYFTFIAIPYLTQYNMMFSDKAEPGMQQTASRLNIMRPPANTSFIDRDRYLFYLGPRSQDVLKHYNTGNNAFDLKEARLDEVSSSRGMLAPLEVALKWLLVMFYGIVKNYGVAIILLTLLIKILFFPLTKKGSEATLRMQALAPKMKELQEKYKSDPKKLQMEMGKFYQQEGYNPLSGCLPMLLQLPIFIAMYGLFNNHFDLRGAMFIPGWIPDLSAPEAVVNFPDGFRVPIFGWTALRALPFVYVGSQLLYGKVTQMPGQQSNAQMKMMLYVMPIVFFFVLYNMPSGLLIYWIFSNLLTLVQQVIINKFVIAKRASAETGAAKDANKDTGAAKSKDESARQKQGSQRKQGSRKKKKK